ncbi:heterokaryon incompatibility protein [Stagonosporopsis vannaccii]|nr:heterokaryon incompatibility protein [Stagonosporopsis vannaccii]
MQQATTPPRLTFVYGDIPPENAFRYLVLHPGGYEDPLECSLLTSYLDAAPQYEAISYVWGTDTLDQHITCNGKSLYITLNLSKALRRFRSPDVMSTLWADSICINQTDLEEKGRQVAIMSQIYRHAARVLIFMGEDPECHGPHVKSLVEDVVEMIDSVIAKLPSSSWGIFPRYTGATPFVNDERWRYLAALLSQSWFTRGWVVREAALARCGNVVWGQSMFSWASLMLVLQWLHTRAYDVTIKHGNLSYLALPHLDAYIDQNIHASPCLTLASVWHPTSLLDYLAAGRKLQMTDPRDRLYAFLDIATGRESRMTVNPSYRDTAPRIYHAFAEQYIQTIKKSRILDYIVHSAQSLQSGIPTWVPFWDYEENGPLRGEGFATLTSRTGSTHAPTLVRTDLLTVRAVILGSVLYTSSTLEGANITFETLANIWTAVQSRIQLSHHKSDFPRTFLSTFIQCGQSGDSREYANLVTKYVEQLVSSSRDRDSDGLMESAVDFSKLEKWIRLYANATRYMLLDRSYMGLGPAVTQQGDLYGIIFGCTTPCILRKTNEHNHFQFMGPCYIPGSHTFESRDGYLKLPCLLGAEDSKDWVDWDVEEQNIILC